MFLELFLLFVLILLCDKWKNANCFPRNNCPGFKQTCLHNKSYVYRCYLVAATRKLFLSCCYVMTPFFALMDLELKF